MQKIEEKLTKKKEKQESYSTPSSSEEEEEEKPGVVERIKNKAKEKIIEKKEAKK